tara:strand:- start:1996 stop:2172 length:177 start_codon:yes stop_codon:yes gene_type:complete
VKPNINRFEVLASEQVDDFIMETVTGKEWVEFKDEKPPHEVVLAAWILSGGTKIRSVG